MPEDRDNNPIIDVTPQPAGFAPRDDIWSFLRRRKGVLGICWLIGSIAALAWVLWRPNRYEAECRVMITRAGSGTPITDAEIASEIELIRDPSHLNTVVLDDLKTASDAKILEHRRSIERDLDAGQAGKSNILAIQYIDNNPTRAAKIVNQIVELYLADRMYIFQPGSIKPVVEENRQGVDTLLKFDAANRGPQIAKTLESRTQRNIDLEAKVSELQAAIRDTQESTNALKKRQAAIPDRLNTRTRVRTGADPTARTVEQTESLNPIKQQIEAELLKNEASLAGLRARLDETQKALSASRNEETRLAGLASERELLERKVEDTQSKIPGNDVPKDAFGAAAPTLRATLINRAVPPLSPLPKHNWFWIPLAILAALAVAFLIAWFIDWFDRPIYTSGDFEDASGAPPIDHFADGAGA